jgi:hypothetical protein
MFRTSRKIPAASGTALSVPARRRRLKSTIVYSPKTTRPKAETADRFDFHRRRVPALGHDWRALVLITRCRANPPR